MSNSKFEYVKSFEIQNELLKNTFIIIRIDGKGFTKFCDTHNFAKPNDIRGIKLMNLAALSVVNTFNEVFLAYGQSDEYSFAFRRDANVYNRRAEKILTYVVSSFTSSYVYNWGKCFKDVELKYPPTFDGRVILYPTLTNLKDYFSWRQVDCHINNLYNTTFWALILMGNLTREEANNRLKGTFAKDKHEILFKDYMINYNSIEEVYKRGTILFKEILHKNKISKVNLKKKEQIVDDIKINIEELQIIDEDSENLQYKTNTCLVDKLLTQDEEYYGLLKGFFSQNIFLCHEDMILDNFWKRFDLY